MAKSKNNKSQVEEKNLEVVEDKESTFYYFYSVGCGFCKKAEPIVDELNKQGHNILKLDLSEKDNQGLKQELEKKYNKKCGTPWFIDGETGNQVCGFREKGDIEKWLKGEDIPAPPRPNGPPPKLPFHGAPKKEVDKWKKDYKKWTKDNEHMPNLQTVEQILERPRPKSDPPRPPAPNSTDKQYDDWAKEYDKWVKENNHLPNLQSSSTILPRLKSQGQAANPSSTNSGLNPDQNARITRVEQKLDKLLRHLGVK
jgi:thiol-disulfide isomerase/thioredoxin